jgi:hypothetical protein
MELRESGFETYEFRDFYYVFRKVCRALFEEAESVIAYLRRAPVKRSIMSSIPIPRGS